MDEIVLLPSLPHASLQLSVQIWQQDLSKASLFSLVCQEFCVASDSKASLT